MLRRSKSIVATIIVVVGGVGTVAGIIVDVPDAIERTMSGGSLGWITTADVCWSLIWAVAILSALLIVWRRPTIDAASIERLPPQLRVTYDLIKAVVGLRAEAEKCREKHGEAKARELELRMFKIGLPEAIQRICGTKERQSYMNVLSTAVDGVSNEEEAHIRAKVAASLWSTKFTEKQSKLWGKEMIGALQFKMEADGREN